MSISKKNNRIKRAVEILARYEQTEMVDPDECLHTPPVTVREEFEEMTDLIGACETIFDQLGW